MKIFSDDWWRWSLWSATTGGAYLGVEAVGKENDGKVMEKIDGEDEVL